MGNSFIAKRLTVQRNSTSTPWVAVVLSSLLFFGAASTAQTLHPAEKLVRETTERALTLVRRPGARADDAAYQSLVNELVLPHFDLERMSRSALGQNWRRFDATQRVEFRTEFTELMVRNYSEVLFRYGDREVGFRPIRKKRSGGVRVRSVIKNLGGGEIPIDYSMSNADGTWKVYDVAFDGVSLIINFRRGFHAEVQRVGPEGLIAKLRSRNARNRTN
ncbi:MAG: ABC transporter substrate-binding protein [Gammaproteobacteria bacterium]|nr:ABC transporter substrate-binding protein [Gammaproteobacteria bacterium]